MAEAAVNPGSMASAIFVIIIVLFVSQDYLIDWSYGGEDGRLPGSGLSDQVDRDAKFRRKCDQSSFGRVKVKVRM